MLLFQEPLRKLQLRCAVGTDKAWEVCHTAAEAYGQLASFQLQVFLKQARLISSCHGWHMIRVQKHTEMTGEAADCNQETAHNDCCSRLSRLTSSAA